MLKWHLCIILPVLRPSYIKINSTTLLKNTKQNIMTFIEKVKEMQTKMFEIISTKEITYLKDLDKRIKINKFGRYNYWRIYEIRNYKVWSFLNELEDNKVYILIPYISANDRRDEPFIVLSQQILITSNSNSLLINDYINNKILNTVNLYNITELNGVLLFKYKSVKIEFHNLKDNKI